MSTLTNIGADYGLSAISVGRILAANGLKDDGKSRGKVTYTTTWNGHGMDVDYVDEAVAALIEAYGYAGNPAKRPKAVAKTLAPLSPAALKLAVGSIEVRQRLAKEDAAEAATWREVTEALRLDWVADARTSRRQRHAQAVSEHPELAQLLDAAAAMFRLNRAAKSSDRSTEIYARKERLMLAMMPYATGRQVEYLTRDCYGCCACGGDHDACSSCSESYREGCDGSGVYSSRTLTSIVYVVAGLRWCWHSPTVRAEHLPEISTAPGVLGRDPERVACDVDQDLAIVDAYLATLERIAA